MRRPFLPWLLCLLLGLAAGCLRRESPVDQGVRERILHRGLAADPAEIDPHVISGLPEINVATALFEGLVAEDPADLHPVPGVAERWDASADGLTYTFHLRADARWSNGEPVTAADFVRSIRRVLSPTLGADYATMLYVLLNAEAYHKGIQADFAHVGVQALDPRTLRFTLEHPAPYFLSLLTHPAWFPVHLPTLERAGPPEQRGNPWTRPATFVGNGPFVLTDWRPGELLAAVKSPTYWDAAAVRLAAIHFHPAADVDSEERAYRAGQLHLTESLPVGKVDTYRRDAAGPLQISPFLDTYFYRLNTTRPGLGNVQVRQALALAIDRAALVEKVTRGGQQPARSFTPPGLAGYAPPASLDRDYTRARALLAAAGYPGGRGLPPLEITINSSGNHRVIAEAIQEMWRRELGVDVRVNNMEQASLLASRRTLDYQIMRADWAGDYLDPTTFLKVFTSDSSNNHTGWKNGEYDRLLYAADRTADPAARLALLQRAEALLLHEVPIIPIYHFTTVRLVHPSVRGWHHTLLDRHPYKHVWLEPVP
ncbi:MAG: peptide ABC transporter substrate-binding protein [Opitutaceae bacterium]|nr:peptide ABC transporter substrate-binding protein [Opitutaceae bacterium]